MFLAKDRAVCLLLLILFSLLASTATFAVDKGDLRPIEKANLQPKRSSPQMEEDNAPTVENILRAKQAGDLEKADRIQAILNEEAKKSWRSSGGDEIVVESPYPTPPQRDNAFCKSHLWDNDHLVCFGPVSGGISVDYDTSENVYAVRCTTGGDFRIYKSTDGGNNWFDIATVDAPLGSSYPVILTGSTGNKLYLFYLRSSQNGDIWMARLTQSGDLEDSYEVKVDSDTITYFSACVDYENGNHLMAAYQKETPSPAVYTITSTDYGETWGNQLFFGGLRAHPDIAYGRNGYVYLVFEYTGGAYSEIEFIRSRNYGELGSWEYSRYLTWGYDSGHNTYPKVAALHTLPDSTPCVWVAYNHENPAGTDIDLRYAWSSNGGKSWSTNKILDSSQACHEMACDLWTKRSTDYEQVHVCYFVGRYVEPFPHGHIYYGQASAAHPTDWGWLFSPTNHWVTQSEDGRRICQGTFAQGDCAIMYVGKEPWDDPFGEDFHYLWFDNSAWPTDVEEEMAEGEAPAEFSLSANYPNPFNPTTVIRYTVGSPQSAVRRPVCTTLKIYNVLGQLVRTLVDKPQEAGTYEVIWNGEDENANEVSSGIYFYRLEAGDFVESRKMLLLK